MENKMGKNMETTITVLYRDILYWGYTGMEKKMEATI